MKYYYAVFKKTNEAIEVEFPDLSGCVTFGKDWDEAFANANDVLAAWLANADVQFIKEPSSHKELANQQQGELIPIAVDETILHKYQKLKRFNVIFPTKVLNAVDSYRKEHGLKRSTVLLKAAKEYLQHYGSRTAT